MPTKYWAKIDDGVEGPYDPQVLRFLDGFSPEILVSPDDGDGTEKWTRVIEVAELQSLLNTRTQKGPVPKVIQVPPPPPPPKLETPLPEPSSDKTVEIKPEKPKEEFVSASEMLDLMDKISQELGQQKKAVPEAPVQIPAKIEPEIQAAAEIVPTPELTETTIKIDLRKPAIALVLVLIIGVLTAWGIKSGKLKVWKEAVMTMIHPKKPEIQEAVPTIPSPETAKPAPLKPIRESAPHAEKKVPVKAKVAALPRPAVKKVEPAVAVPEPVAPPKPAVEETPKMSPEEEKELQSQKFYLPGVPSPNLSKARVDNSAPLPETKEEVPAPAKKEKAPQDKAAKSDKKAGSDWMNQPGWGE